MQDRITEISAIIGALYVIARVIVALTPTPQDDEALKKVAKWIKLLTMVTGLNIKQGLKKYEP